MLECWLFSPQLWLWLCIYVGQLLGTFFCSMALFACVGAGLEMINGEHGV